MFLLASFDHFFLFFAQYSLKLATHGLSSIIAFPTLRNGQRTPHRTLHQDSCPCIHNNPHSSLMNGSGAQNHEMDRTACGGLCLV